MNLQKAPNKKAITYLGLLLIGLITVYAYLKWKNTPQPEQATTSYSETETTANSTDTPTTETIKKKDERVIMDISDPVGPDYPIPPYDPAPPDSVMEKYGAKDPVIPPNPVTTNDNVYDVVDIMPSYIDGEKAYYEFISKNLVYPIFDKEADNEGTVYLSGIVETDGTISNLKVLRAFSESAGQEALRVAKLTKWNPGKLNGKVVRVKMNLPFKFRLN